MNAVYVVIFLQKGEFECKSIAFNFKTDAVKFIEMLISENIIDHKKCADINMYDVCNSFKEANRYVKESIN